MIEELANISEIVKNNTVELSCSVDIFNEGTHTATTSIELMANGATETSKEIEKEYNSLINVVNPNCFVGI